MATLFDSASLVMIPSGYKDDKLYSVKPTDGSGDFTFSRDGSGASPATRVNASGLIEKGRENLILQSNSFDTTWTAILGTSLTSGQSGYDGSSDAWLMTSDGVSGFAPMSQNITFSGVSTFSIYAKEGTNQYISLRSLGATDVRAIFNLNTGSLHSSSNTIATNITSIGSGWYRLEMVLNASNTSVVIYPNILGTASAGNIYIQDAQLEQGLVATAPAIETTTAPVSAGLLGDMPRLDYSGGATCPSLLLEPSRVNSFVNSEYFGGWASNRMNATANAATSPEGVINAYKLAQQSGFTTAPNVNLGAFAAGTYSVSIFAKAGDWNYLALSFDGVSYFNLSNGTKGTTHPNHTTDIEDYGNGWYRCIVYRTTTASQTPAFYVAQTDNSLTTTDTQGFIYAYGAQLESSASYPTSYIPTYGSASTRAEDYADNAGDASVFNDTEGVLYLESSWLSTALGTSTIAISDGTNSNRIILGYIGADDDLYCTSIGGGSSPSLMRYDVGDITTNHKIAIKYKANDFAFWVDGVERGTQSSGTTPVGLSELSFSSGAGGSKIFGNAKQILYFPTALTDAELASLTTL